MATPTENVSQVSQVDQKNKESTLEEEHLHKNIEKRKRTSQVWKEFSSVIIDNKEYNQCKHCEKKYLKSTSGCTTQLNRHLVKCPKKKKTKGQQELAIVPHLPNQDEDLEFASVTTYKYDKEMVRKILCILTIVDERPFRSVESKLFNMFCKALNPRHQKISRHTIRNDCIKLYYEEKNALKNMLKEIDSVCFTCDTWTSGQTKSYLSFTVHYVDADWKLHKKILNFCHFPPPHTGYAMANLVSELMMDCGLEDKIFTLTLDNASANDSMVTLLKDSFPSNAKFTIRCNVFHVRCSAHILNLIVQAGLVHVKGVIENVRESIKYIKGSTSRMEDFDTSLAHVGISSKRGLNLDVQTRWNSTYLMLRSAKEVKLAFNHLKGIDENFKWCPSDMDWNKYDEIEYLLEVFYQATNAFSMSKYPTSNLFFAVLQKVKEKLDYLHVHGQGHIYQMVDRMKDKYDKYWAENSLVLAIACVLDPRYKLGRVEFVFRKIYHSESIFLAEMKKVEDALKGVYKFYENKLRNSLHHDYFPENESSDKMLTDEEEFERFMDSREQFHVNKSDLDAYLEEQRIKVNHGAHFDVLDYWKTASLKYKTLGAIAKDILAIPLSSVASESAFSTGGRVINDYRSSLKPNTIEALICAQDWLRPRYCEEREDEDDEDSDPKVN